MLVELLDLIATVNATQNPIMRQSNGVKLYNNWHHKLEQSTTKKAQPKSGKVPAKKATATSDEKLDEAVKQGKWFRDAHINEAMKMIQSQFPSLAGFHNS